MPRADLDTRWRWVYPAALVLATGLSRLPQLLSPHLLLDGDEAIVGLMARHLAEGREIPVFFYGQTYGLSLVEAAAGAASFAVAGPGATALKVAMLALWTAGIVAFFHAAARLLGERAGFWTTLILVVSPAWAVWSMKARGGYLTAFVAAAMLLALLVRPAERQGPAVWMSCGALTAVIYLAQRIWLPGMLPIVAFLLLARRRMSHGLAYLAGAAIVLLPALAATGALEGDWAAPRPVNQDLLGSVPDTLHQIYVSFTGFYYLWFTLDPTPAARTSAVIWCGLLVAALAVQAYRIAAGRYLPWSHLLSAAVVATLVANWILLDARDARYLLPLQGLLVLWVAVEFRDLSARVTLHSRLRALTVAALLVVGSVAMVEFRTFSYLWTNPPGSLSEHRRLRDVIGHLKMRGVTHVFSLHGLLQWQLMFYSDEGMVARWTAPHDRYPAYVAEVDRALREGETVALVGYVGSTRGLEDYVDDPQRIVTVDGKYFIYPDPDEELLRKLQFRFADERDRQ